ncbi:MAG TPA: hypothetical protein VN832_14515 [Stellaceae bacterium]|nr:hypothetical protein [Stellaceae bacterium]
MQVLVLFLLKNLIEQAIIPHMTRRCGSEYTVSMGFLRYCGTVIRVAATHSLDIAQGIIFVLLVAAGTIKYLFPAVEVTVDLSGWQVATAVLGIIVGLRFLLAPYWLYRELLEQTSSAEANLQIRAIEAQEAHTAELRRQRELRERQNDLEFRAKQMHEEIWLRRFYGVRDSRQ